MAISSWSITAVPELTAKRQFALIDSDRSSLVNITDFHRLWSQNPEIIFQTGYRIAGTIADIGAVLIPMGINEEQLQDLAKTAITSTNYTEDMASVYNDEKAQYFARRQSVLKANTDAPGYKLFDVMSALNPDLIRKAKSAKETKMLGIATKSSGRTVDLSVRLANVPPGKLLDVSKINPNGTGTTYIDPPVRVIKIGSPRLPMVSIDLEHYLLAISMLPNSQQYNEDMAYVRARFGQPAAAIPNPGPITVQVQAPTIQPASDVIPYTVPVNIVPEYQKTYPTLTKTERKRKKETAIAMAQFQSMMPPPIAPKSPTLVVNQGAIPIAPKSPTLVVNQGAIPIAPKSPSVTLNLQLINPMPPVSPNLTLNLPPIVNATKPIIRELPQALVSSTTSSQDSQESQEQEDLDEESEEEEPVMDVGEENEE